MDPEQSKDSNWKEVVGLADGTDKVAIYCKESDKEAWTEEAEEKGYPSRSKYLYDLVIEGQRVRETDFFDKPGDSEQNEELRERINELHDEISRLKGSPDGDPNLIVPDLVLGELSEEYRTHDELVSSILDSDRIENHVREEVEDILYDLIDADRAEYQIGHGWRHVPEGDS
ncbi:hypothetical protein [Halopenitus persicus]|uniref:hypothetical protein n=1 Tax=Halopenitus persicus TaxID=1048396 RepID=UPI0012FE303C|nr:hypothetical protein [Halopenitus persicus]